MTDLWGERASASWLTALDRYADVVAGQAVRQLELLDTWDRTELPAMIA